MIAAQGQGLLLVVVVVLVFVSMSCGASVLEQRIALARRVVYVRGGEVCFYPIFVSVPELSVKGV